MESKGSYKFVGLLEQLAGKVEIMDKKLDDLRTEHVADMKARMLVAESKISRIEWLLYGAIAIVMTEGIALIFSFLKNG